MLAVTCQVVKQPESLKRKQVRHSAWPNLDTCLELLLANALFSSSTEARRRGKRTELSLAFLLLAGTLAILHE